MQTVVNTSTGTTHIVRNAQVEYISRKRRSVKYDETYCGRHYERPESVTRRRKSRCKKCLQAHKAASAKRKR